MRGSASHPRRYIIVQPCCQLCNRLRVLVSALALGILTNRAVLMDFDGSGSKSDYYGRFDDLFESPLRVQSTRTSRELRTAMTAGSERTLSWLHMMTGFLCDDPLSWQESVLIVQGSPAFLHSLRLSPSLAPAFDRAFGGLEGLFRDIVYELLMPRAELVEEARAFVRGLASAAVRPSTFVVGLHIRNGRDFRTRKLTEGEWSKLGVCARALVPGLEHDGDGDGGRTVEAAYVIATESADSQAAATAALGAQATVYKPSLPKGGGDGASSSREGAKRALVELLIVSMSNATVLTPMSSFSETAAALSGRPGLYFHFDKSRKFHFESATEVQPGCFVPWTSEMPGSMNLHSLLGELTCAEDVRHASRGSRWVEPTGLRFLDGTSALPEKLAKKVTPF